MGDIILDGVDNLLIENSFSCEKQLKTNEDNSCSYLSSRTIIQVIAAVTWIPRFVFAVLRLFPLLIIFGVGSLFYRNNYLDPTEIRSNKTPIILIHGSGANQRQWDFVRQFFKSSETGHVYSLNLNDQPFGNDNKSISEYAQIRLKAKIDSLKDKYLKANIRLDEVILVGHSMGSLVGADYAVNYAEESGVKVKSLISISSPWEGSKIADVLYDINQKPEGAFVTTNETRINLKNQLLDKVRNGNIHVYTFSSSFDPMVRPSSSCLELAPECQMTSKIHDHYSTMTDTFLALSIREQWIVPNTSSLSHI